MAKLTASLNTILTDVTNRSDLNFDILFTNLIDVNIAHSYFHITHNMFRTDCAYCVKTILKFNECFIICV